MQGIPSDMEHLPEFVYIESKELENQTLIMSTRLLVIGRVWMFRTQEEMDAFENNSRTMTYQVPGYRILISFSKNLGRHAYKLLQGVVLPEIMPEMAMFYLNDRIIPHAPRYKKYLIAE